MVPAHLAFSLHYLPARSVGRDLCDIHGGKPVFSRRFRVSFWCMTPEMGYEIRRQNAVSCTGGGSDEIDV
jgi:hypothetical protein